MENFDKFSNKLNLGKRSEYRNCESCGGVGCPDCYGFGSSMKNPEFDEATKEEYLKLKRSMRGIEDDERDPGHGEMVRIANIRIGELDRKFPGLKDLPELKDLKENKLTTMEKKLITEMKFMMERLENPRMTYVEYEKKHNQLVKEDGEESEKPMMPKKPSTKGKGLPEKPSKESPFLKPEVEPKLPELKEDEEDNHYERDYDYILDELGKYGLHPYSGWFDEFENSKFYEPEMSDEEYVDVIYDFIINGDNEY